MADWPDNKLYNPFLGLGDLERLGSTNTPRLKIPLQNC